MSQELLTTDEDQPKASEYFPNIFKGYSSRVVLCSDLFLFYLESVYLWTQNVSVYYTPV